MWPLNLFHVRFTKCSSCSFISLLGSCGSYQHSAHVPSLTTTQKRNSTNSTCGLLSWISAFHSASFTACIRLPACLRFIWRHNAAGAHNVYSQLFWHYEVVLYKLHFVLKMLLPQEICEVDVAWQFSWLCLSFQFVYVTYKCVWNVVCNHIFLDICD